MNANTTTTRAESPAREFRPRNVDRSTRATESTALADLKDKGAELVAVETVRGAARYHRFDYRFPIALVLGNEALGVSEPALKLCDAVVEIPVFGYKNSINVATAAGIVLYDVLRQGEWLDAPEPTRPGGTGESGT